MVSHAPDQAIGARRAEPPGRPPTDGVTLTGDPEFAATIFVAVATHPDPRALFELAAVVLRFAGRQFYPVSTLRTVPDPQAPLELTAQRSRLPADLLRGRPPAAVALAYLDRHLPEAGEGASPYALVTHHARTLAPLIHAHQDICPTLAATPILETARLAEYLNPALPVGDLHELAERLGVRRPVQPSLAATAAERTSGLFIHLMRAAERQRGFDLA